MLIPRGDGLGPESLATEWLMDLSHKYFVFKLLRLQKEPFKADTNFPRCRFSGISEQGVFVAEKQQISPPWEKNIS